MGATTYIARRGELETYFDRTAVDAWRRLTSDAPVGRIRATVRAGRDAMRAALLSWLPDDMRGMRLLDAGCGTGALAIEAARRGADVVAIDISPTLVGLAKERAARGPGAGRIAFAVGDMLDPPGGRFDHIVAMDSLIHYEGRDIARALAALGQRAERSIVFTVAPRTPALSVMHAVGRLFPRADRAPAIEPISQRALRRFMSAEEGLDAWRLARAHRVTSGFYLSQALELTRP
jgi:magnesium-protoporphyrin O-methyltransferase